MTKGNYSYPLDPSWSTEEITTVLHFLSQVEKAYESKVDRDQLLEAYKAFKTVVPGKAPEKQLDKAFQEASGFSIYQAVRAAKAKEKGFKQLMITCSPDNIASRKIIESLPFKYLETKEVPACLKKDFDQGDYIKRIYCLDLEEL